MLRTDSKKYPSEIWERVKITLRKEHGGKFSHTELDDQIEVMTKIEVMDKYFDSFEENINSSEICRFVKSMFNFDLDATPVLSKELEKALEVVSSTKDRTILPLSRVVIDSYLYQDGKKVTGAEVRKIINQIFGINLGAIASLEGARISIYSKDQWVVQHKKDLFVVHTGTGDVDVKIFPTKYFTEQTGLEVLPNDLKHSLTSMGFYYDEKIGCYYFANPTGEAVPDGFKGQTIGAIIKVINNSYSYL